MRDQIISKMASFPTVSAIVSKLLRLIDEDDADFSKISEIIKYDPALTANILKAANSAYLGYSKEVASLSEASIRLGTKWIFKIAVSSLIDSKLKVPAKGYEMSGDDIWRHSMAAAIAAENLCEELKIKDNGQVFTAALLHDIGKIHIGEFLTTKFEEIQNLALENNLSFETAEREILGIDHAEIGGLIAEKWDFPEEIIECIRWHHNPDHAETIASAIDVVHCADALCLMACIGAGKDGLQYKPSDSAISRLNISTNIIELVTSQIIESLDDINNMFEDSEVTAEEPVGRW
ncbi:MAG: HDOD domain-containing protein [candidate division Zixibacteria bacterium]|nr:HDOD domain-containing protein [candidate division Zixibacteria bacterium]